MKCEARKRHEKKNTWNREGCGLFPTQRTAAECWEVTITCFSLHEFDPLFRHKSLFSWVRRTSKRKRRFGRAFKAVSMRTDLVAALFRAVSRERNCDFWHCLYLLFRLEEQPVRQEPEIRPMLYVRIFRNPANNFFKYMYCILQIYGNNLLIG